MTTSARDHVQLSHARLATTLSTLTDAPTPTWPRAAQHMIVAMGAPLDLEPVEALLAAARNECVSPSAAG